MVKFYSVKPRVKVELLKIGFRSIFDAKMANKYLGKNETIPIQLSMEISNEQKSVLDEVGVSYYLVD